MDAVVQVLLQGGPSVVLIVIGIIVYLTIDKKLKSSLENIGKKLDDYVQTNKDLLLQKEKYDFIISNFDLLEKLVNSTKGIKEVTHFIDFELERLREDFNANFSNGSHADKAHDSVEQFREKCLEYISNSNTILKLQSIWLLELIIIELQELISQLVSMNQINIKKKLINTYLFSLMQLLDYYKIFSNTSTFTSLDEDQIKYELLNKFISFGSRKSLPNKNIL